MHVDGLSYGRPFTCPRTSAGPDASSWVEPGLLGQNENHRWKTYCVLVCCGLPPQSGAKANVKAKAKIENKQRLSAGKTLLQYQSFEVPLLLFMATSPLFLQYWVKVIREGRNGAYAITAVGTMMSSSCAECHILACPFLYMIASSVLFPCFIFIWKEKDPLQCFTL